MSVTDYLRISLIDRCNFRCVYCMPEGEELSYLLGPELLTNDEILTLVTEVFGPLGFRRFRLTGGEPLLRPGLVDLVANLAALPTTEDLALTTNGFLLADLAADLYAAGLRRINISLDSLNPDTFDLLAGNRGRSRWPQVWAGIQAAHAAGFDPLKLNVVVIPGINDGEVEALAGLTRDRNWHVRFIEFMPIGNDALFGDRGWISSESLRDRIRGLWGLDDGSVLGAGPADVFQIPGAIGTVGFISQMSECFCDRCNRMRLSADGWLRPCLLNESAQIDLRSPLRSGERLGALRDRVAALLAAKPEINFKQRDAGTTGRYGRTMSQIGG
ncbi:MAG: GTP 3',8-cyclase MoaA [Cyanobacteria bacterium]|nr:GTP 3',8-cyclase MoaA [Cyanobacteriota bacterium]